LSIRNRERTLLLEVPGQRQVGCERKRKAEIMLRDRRILDLFGIELPIIQAPMAGSTGAEMAIAVSEAGGLGSLPCAMLTPEQVRTELAIIRQRTSRPLNVNFFCHHPPQPDAAREAAWKTRLEPYYLELGLDPAAPTAPTIRLPFDSAMCDVVEEVAPSVVSFHYGLPEKGLLDRVKATGAKVLSAATTVDEARWLEDNGCDAIIAQGYEAGGHRGMFLARDLSTQVGTLALVPQMADAVKVPVVAAGGIADARGVAAALVLGAAAVQIGTAYLFCPEALTSPVHRAALKSAKGDQTTLTNVFSGRPARGVINRFMREVGPLSDLAPEFPLAGGAVAPLRSKAEESGSKDFSALWAGQAVALGRVLPAGELTRQLEADALARLRS
jgi:nitronate monooxygenase